MFADGGTAADAQDADGVDVESVAHSDANGVVKYVVRTFGAVRADQIGEMRWDLDLDGDRQVRTADDACIVMKPLRGTNKLRAGIYEGCRGSAFATADTRVQGQVIKLRVLVDELEHAGLDDDAPGYAYRFASRDRSGVTDTVPDGANAFVTHELTGRGTVRRVEAADTTPTPSPSPTARASASPTPTPSGPSKGGAKDTSSTGKADETTVEPGDDVDIEGGGFARHKGLEIFLVGGATSTATQATPSPSPTASASASPTPTSSSLAIQRSRTSQTRSADVVVGQSVGGQHVSRSFVSGAEPALMGAAAAKGERIGLAISDDDGNFDDEAEIPDDTKPGTYRILVEGPNPRGGTNTVSIPIKVAADVDNGTNGGSSGPAGNPAVNATGTATQATPVAGQAANPSLPQTGSNAVQKLFGLGLLALVLGASLMLARRVMAAPVAVAPTPVLAPLRLVFETPQELRGEMQRLLARRADRYDPDRDADL